MHTLLLSLLGRADLLDMKGVLRSSLHASLLPDMLRQLLSLLGCTLRTVWTQRLHQSMVVLGVSRRPHGGKVPLLLLSKPRMEGHLPPELLLRFAGPHMDGAQQQGGHEGALGRRQGAC